MHLPIADRPCEALDMRVFQVLHYWTSSRWIRREVLAAAADADVLVAFDAEGPANLIGTRIILVPVSTVRDWIVLHARSARQARALIRFIVGHEADHADEPLDWLMSPLPADLMADWSGMIDLIVEGLPIEPVIRLLRSFRRGDAEHLPGSVRAAYILSEYRSFAY